MKRIILIVILLAMVTTFFSCSKSPDASSSDEQRIIDLLKTISNDFYEPSAVRLLEIGDCRFKLYNAKNFTGMGKGYFYGIVLKLQGENKLGGTLSHYYLLRIETVTGSDAVLDANLNYNSEADYDFETWNNCPSYQWPKNRFKTYEEYREYIINYRLENIYFASKDEALDAAADEFEKNGMSFEEWDECPLDEYPRNRYKTYIAYQKYWIEEYKLKSYKYPFSKPYTLLTSTPDNSGLYCELTNYSSIHISAEETYSVSKINQALKAYWDDRLGNK